MVLHHVVSAKELVLLLDVKANYKEVVTEKVLEELDRVFAKGRNLLAMRHAKLHNQTNLTKGR